jgi:beta-lactamase superfamily II metal-dependent hydrolase
VERPPDGRKGDVPPWLTLALRGLAEMAAYLDKSVHNLSSIVVLVESQGKRILLTGDGRGDHTLEGLKAAKLLKSGKLRVDV